MSWPIGSKAFFNLLPFATSLGLIASVTPYTHSPEEKFPYKIGSQIEHKGELLTIVGITGHSRKTVENGLWAEPLYHVKDEKQLPITQKFAGLNSRGKNDEPVVAVLVAKNPSALKYAPQRFEGPYSPWSPESMEEAGMAVYNMISITENNDARYEACFKRAVIEGTQFPKILDHNEAPGAIPKDHTGQTFF